MLMREGGELFFVPATLGILIVTHFGLIQPGNFLDFEKGEGQKGISRVDFFWGGGAFATSHQHIFIKISVLAGNTKVYTYLRIQYPH